MTLARGSRIGPYEIVSSLGAGGMGEVYRARDAKLNRDVAIKVLLPSVANDPDRLARFSREAQVLASLNHPNIAQVHGFEDAEGVRALVMELVEGPTLADRIGHGPISLDEALPIAKQIAEALEAAHAQGIIHRDLKPANIKVRADGAVKVLDFGLAKALDPIGALGTDAAISPTLSLHATQAGVILGTAAYMSPEQARGKTVDARTDIWAFGCVLFEMLTGRRAFQGDEVTDTIVAVVSKEPDWQALPAAASSVRSLLARCLRKDPRQRLQAIGDARLHLEELIDGASEPGALSAAPVPLLRRVTPWVIAAAVGTAVVTALVTWAAVKPAQPDPPLPVRLEISGPAEPGLSRAGGQREIAISPDGRNIAYRTDPQARLVIRPLDRLNGRVLEGSANARQPFFSPDGRWVGFFDGSALKKVPISGGPATTICEINTLNGASWGDDGNIVFGTRDTSTGLLRVSAAGGEPTVLSRPDASKGEEDHRHMSVLPGNRGILFTVIGLKSQDPPQVGVLDLKTGQQKTLIRGGSQPEYLETGHLVYAVGGTLSAVPFDLAGLEVQGDPVVVVDDVSMSFGAANYEVSRRGTLVYVRERGTNPPRALHWVDRTGRETPIAAPSLSYASPRLSPDGSRIAVMIRDQENDIYVYDLQRETLVRLASSPSVESFPIWTRDGQRIVFASNRDGVSNLYEQAADGTGAVTRLTTGPDPKLPAWVAPDGSGILGTEISPKTQGDILWFSAKPGGSSGINPANGFSLLPERLVASPFIDYFPDVSPNGRYVSYQSSVSGRDEIYVRPFPRVQDGEWRVSMNGGRKPVWAKNGRELYYVDPVHALMAVPVETSGSTFTFGNRSKLFEISPQAPYAARDYDVAKDGRFLMAKTDPTADQQRLTIVVVLNWFEELREKFQGSKVP